MYNRIQFILSQTTYAGAEDFNQLINSFSILLKSRKLHKKTDLCLNLQNNTCIMHHSLKK